MESRMLQNNMKRVIWSIIGYNLGGAIFIINGGEEPILSILSKMIGVAVGIAISDIHTYRKNPKMKIIEKVQNEDERNRVIRDRASYYTYWAVIIVLFVMTIIGEIMKDDYMTYGSASAAVLLMVTHMFISWIVSKGI